MFLKQTFHSIGVAAMLHAHTATTRFDTSVPVCVSTPIHHWATMAALTEASRVLRASQIDFDWVLAGVWQTVVSLPKTIMQAAMHPEITWRPVLQVFVRGVG